MIKYQHSSNKCLFRITSILAYFLAVLLGGMSVSASISEGNLFNESFELGNSTEWTTNAGTWSIIADGDQKVFKQTQEGSNGLCYAGHPNWVNYSVQADLKLHETTGKVGIIGRYIDKKNYYWLKLNNNALELYSIVNNWPTKLGSASVSIETEKWNTLKLEMMGVTIKAYLNDDLLIESIDSGLSKGHCGAKSEKSSFSIDNVIVEGDDDIKPLMITGNPTPGQLVKQYGEETVSQNIYHALYLPKNYTPGKLYPVIVEYPCNEWYGLTGKVEDANMGYYLSGGQDYIWVIMPVIDSASLNNLNTGWGSNSNTIKYLKTNLRKVLETYGGDPSKVILTGFSRGAVNCNFMGTNNDDVADIWLGFLPFAHMDGGLIPDHTDTNGMTRVGRTYGRSTFVAYGEKDDAGSKNSLVGYNNLMNWGYPTEKCAIPDMTHTDLWVKFDNPSRQKARKWLQDTILNHPGTWAISGKVTENGVGVSDVVVENGSTHFTKTDSAGNYTLANLITGKHFIKATKSGYAFDSISTTIDKANVANVNFNVGSSTNPATSAPTPIDNLTIYSDSFDPSWRDNGWSSTRTPVSAEQIHSGSNSYKMTITAKSGAAGMVPVSGSFDNSLYQSISFWINGGPNGGQHLKLVGYSSKLGEFKLNSLKANTWEHYTINFSEMSFDYETKVVALRFIDMDGSSVNKPFYMDDMTLIKSDKVIALATLDTVSVNNVSYFTASAKGIITADGGAPVNERGVCWSTTTNPSTSSSKASAGSGSGVFTANITGLTENTTYYVKSYATNAKGTAYGNELTFNTNKQPTIPDIKSILSTSGSVGKDFSYTINSDSNPAALNYNASNLPEGLVVNTTTGVISGVPTKMGQFSVTISATNANGSGSATLDLIVGEPVFIYPYQPYNDGKMDPQLTGWPLTTAEIIYTSIPNYSRRPGSEATPSKQLPEYMPKTPSALGKWHVDIHRDFMTVIESYKNDNGTDVDVLLVGDSITAQWCGMAAYNAYPQKFNSPWENKMGDLKTINIGIGGDTIEGVLWRLDHSGTVMGDLNPKVIVLAIGHNDMYYTGSTGIPAVAEGIKICTLNLKQKYPRANIIVVKVLPSNKPDHQFYKDAFAINQELEKLNLGTLANVTVLPDMWNDWINSDGTLKSGLLRDGVHPSQDMGYALYAELLQKALTPLLANNSSVMIKPTVKTAGIQYISTTSAVCEGEITNKGDSEITAYGVCWGVQINPTIENHVITNTGSPNTFASQMNNLTSGTTYHVRAFASNKAGTSYGEDLQFMTLVENVTSGYLKIYDDQYQNN
jgi:lysophospholipase L1-like esterase